MSGYMKGVVVMDEGKVEVVYDIPIPEPGDYDVLVKVKACGICSGTDLQYIDGTEKETLGEYPTVLGHEGAGEVVAVGGKVRYIKVGDCFIHTNLREDTGSKYSKTHGGMAEYGLIPDINAILEDGYSIEEVPEVTGYGTRVYTYQDGPDVNGRLGKDMDLVDAGVFQSLAESLSAAINFGVKEGDSVLVYGCGPMGIAIQLFCKLLGASHVTVIDSIPERLELAKKVGRADLAINFSTENVDDILDGKLFDIVIDAAGKSQILIEGSHRCKCNGVVGAMGVLKKEDAAFDVQRIKNSVRLHMLNFPYHSFAKLDLLQELIRSGEVNPKDFISHVIPMEDVHKGIDMIRSHQAFKVILTF
jgi:threonine dehydrogenase-like Zn-dependent dehydrogenase